VFDNTKFNIFMQSANKHLTIKNGCAVRQLRGTARFTNVSDSTVAIFKLGPVGFGIAETCTGTNVTLTTQGNPDIAQALFSAGGVIDPGMITSTGVDVDYTMADGIIKAPKAGMAYPLHWAIPGGWCQFVGGVNPSANGPFWQVVDQWEDADYVYVQTTWPGGFPPWGPGIQIKSHACPNVTFINCTGHEDIVRLSAAYAAGYGGKPYGTYLSRSFNGSNLGTLIAGSIMPASAPMLGKLVSYKFDVTTPYTGNNNPLWWRVGAPFGGHTILPDLTTRVDFMPVIDLRTAGMRIMTPKGTTGARPGDSGLTLVDPNEWLSNVIMGFAAAPPDVTAEFAANPSVGPLVTIELITDQEIT
jgi:hypothetical protein